MHGETEFRQKKSVNPESTRKVDVQAQAGTITGSGAFVFCPLPLKGGNP